MKLIFVYNADAGLKAALFDSLHKLISPKTYMCHLCQLTHGLLSERQTWKDYLLSTNLEIEFLHRDEFLNSYQVKTDLPAIYKVLDKELVLLLGPRDIQSLETELELIDRLKSLEKPNATAE